MGCKVLSSNDYRITCGFTSHQKRVRGRQHIYGVDIVTAKYGICNITAHSDGIVKRVVDYMRAKMRTLRRGINCYAIRSGAKECASALFLN